MNPTMIKMKSTIIEMKSTMIEMEVITIARNYCDDDKLLVLHNINRKNKLRVANILS